MTKDNLIGKTDTKNGLPWHYSEDLRYYRSKTINKINVQGHKTYLEIGKALPNRDTYVMSRDVNLKLDDAIVINNVEDILKLDSDKIEIMITGGIEIFKLYENHIERIYLTKINKSYDGDIYYHDLNLKNFKLIKKMAGSNKDLSFEVYENEKNK